MYNKVVHVQLVFDYVYSYTFMSYVAILFQFKLRNYAKTTGYVTSI